MWKLCQGSLLRMHQALCFCLTSPIFVKNEVALIVASSFLTFDSRKCLILTLQFNTEAGARSKGAKDAEAPPLG